MGAQGRSQNRGKTSLAARLVIGAAVWAAVLLLIGAIALTTLYRSAILRDFDQRLEATVTHLVSWTVVAEDGSLVLERPLADTRYDLIDGQGYYWQVHDLADQSEGVLLASRSIWDETVEIPKSVLERARAEPGRVIAYDVLGPGKPPGLDAAMEEAEFQRPPLRVLGRAITLPDQDSPVFILASANSGSIEEQVRRFALISGLMFFGFATAIAAGVFVQVRIGLAPVLRMGDSVAEVREGRSERVEGSFPVELQGLADELNSLLDHSRDIVERSRTHVGNLAHALKTPIAVLTNESRGRDDELARLVARQTEAMSQQVDHHLRRARAAAHAKAVGARTEIAPLVEDLTRTLRRIYARDGVRIETELEPDLVFRGERQDLEEMLGNLIDNACKYSGGLVNIAVRRDGAEDGRSALILIEDDGPGLDEEACKAATERGVRLDEQGPGSGLGLAIVADLARAYEGSLQLDRSQMGGLRARLDLPAAAPN